jgi:hypothetical protein
MKEFDLIGVRLSAFIFVIFVLSCDLNLQMTLPQPGKTAIAVPFSARPASLKSQQADGTALATIRSSGRSGRDVEFPGTRPIVTYGVSPHEQNSAQACPAHFCRKIA